MRDVDPTRLRQLQSLALPHDDVLAIGTTRGRVVVVDLKDGAARGSIELGGGPVDVEEGPRPGTVLCHRRDADLLFDVDSGALFPVAVGGVDAARSVALPAPVVRIPVGRCGYRRRRRRRRSR